MDNDDKILLTMEVQEMLPRVLFMQEKNQKYFDDWVNGEVYDIEEDVIPSINKVMKRVKEGKLVLKGFGYIHKVIQGSYMERTGTPSLEMVIGDLSTNLKGF